MTKVKHNQVALKLPRVAPLLIVHGRHVVQAMTDNAWFPSPTPPLATVTADIDALEASEVAVRSRTKGTAAVRDLEKKTVEDDMFALKAYVQGIVNQNPEQAVAIIASAGMKTRKVTPIQKPELEARMGPSAGEAVVRAKAVKRGAAYEWQISSDGGSTWTAMSTTTVANTSAPGLTAGTTYLFRFRTTIRKTTGEWSRSVSLFAH